MKIHGDSLFDIRSARWYEPMYLSEKNVWLIYLDFDLLVLNDKFKLFVYILKPLMEVPTFPGKSGLRGYATCAVMSMRAFEPNPNKKALYLLLTSSMLYFFPDRSSSSVM